MKIALFGGSFNPIHIGHIKLAQYTISKLSIDLLIFIPTYKSVEKLDLFHEDPQHRCNLINLVLLPKTKLSTFEIDKGYPVESHETVDHFSKLYPNDELFFLIGEDNLKTLDEWGGIEKIVNLSKIVVWKRFEDCKYCNLSKFTNEFLFLNNPIFNYSSTEFRDENKNIHMLDPKVLEYIKKHKIYNFH